jgi:putative ABC transport system permease protein
MPRPLLLDLLRTVTWPHWRRHRLRTLLTAIGVALGVASVVGMADVSETMLASFRRVVDTIGGDCELEVTSPAGGLSEELVERVAAVPGVRAAAGVVEAFLPLAERPGELLYVIGTDFLASPVWEVQLPRSAIALEDEIEFLSQPDSLVLSRTFLARQGLDVGAAVPLLSPSGQRTLRVRGVMSDVAPARLFDGALALMDLPAAQRLLGRDTLVDRIAVKLVPGAAPDEVGGRIRAALRQPDGLEVSPPESRGKQAESLLFALRTSLAVISAVAVIVGTLIVYHVVAASVHERRREFALLNVAGVTPRALVALCLTETLLLALAGAAVGVAQGHLFARVAAGVAGGVVSDVWVRLEVDALAAPSGGVVAGICAGVVTALASALLAVRATFVTTTVEALRPFGFGVDERGATAGILALAVALLGGSWLIALAPPGLGFGAVVTLIVGAAAAGYAAGALLAPALVQIAGRAADRVGRRVATLPLRLATSNLPRAPRRSGATVGTITVAVAVGVVVTATVWSFNAAWVGWVETYFASDLLVGVGSRLQLHTGSLMPAAVADRLRAVPGVTSVEPFRARRIRVGGRPAFLQGVSLAERLAHGALPMVDGDLREAAGALEAGSGVLLSDNLAFRLGLRRGDGIDLPTPGGRRRFRVEGTYVDYLGATDLGAVAVAHSQLAAIWNDRTANLFRVWLRPGADASMVREAILAQLGPRGYFVLTAREFLDGINALVRGFFFSTWAMQIVAALVGVIGVVNAQLATVLDRRSEIALLRTIGVDERDVTRSVLLECAALGALGGLAGIAIGTAVGAQIVRIGLRLVTGWQLPFTLPVAPLVAAVAIATALSALAGWVPARAAARVATTQRSID